MRAQPFSCSFSRFIWDLHAYKFMDEMDELYNECKEGSEDLPEMLLETGHWLDDFWKQAPNITVSFLLRQIFSDGLKSRRKNNITLYPGPNRNKGNSPSRSVFLITGGDIL